MVPLGREGKVVRFAPLAGGHDEDLYYHRFADVLADVRRDGTDEMSLQIENKQ